MPSYDDFSAGHQKHLEMIQAVIARLGTNAFVVKGWAITVSGAFLGFAVTKDKWALALASVMPTVLFWLLDAQFLRAERAFRLLYERVRAGGAADPFFLNATSPAFLASVPESDKHWASYRSVVMRPTLKLLYGALLIAGTLVALLLAVGGTTEDRHHEQRHPRRSALCVTGQSPSHAGGECLSVEAI
ncbi:MAG: hypothetical protein JWR83_1616 [Aeromicrobium sp.]|nr:hypothetical protein [Aeromicrobium sp.]